MGEHEFRVAEGEDLAAVEAVIEAAYRPWVAAIGAVPAPLEDKYAPAIATGRVTLAVAEGQVQGLKILVPQADALLIENIAVLPATQGSGLGKRLMARAEAQERQVGLLLLWLYTHNLLRLYTQIMMVSNVAFYGALRFWQVREAQERGLHRVYADKVLGTPT